MPSFSHDYPDDPELQAATINKAYDLAAQLLEVLNIVSTFILPYTIRRSACRAD